MAAWLAENPQHRQAYELLGAQWQLLKPLKDKNFPVRQAALVYRASARYRWRTYAAAAALLLALGLFAFNPDGWLGLSRTYVATKGQTQSIVLADQSRIELNTDSEVRVHFDHWRRTVEMVRGEAFFTVVHDAGRPFEVRSGTGIIQDIGTAFDVYKKADRTVVAVQEGEVEVFARSRRKLPAGQSASFDAAGNFVATPEQDPDNLSAWRKGQLIFRNSKLTDVLQEISRYHDAQISLNDPSLGALRVSGVFYTANLSDLLNAIRAILPVDIDSTGNRFVIRRAEQGIQANR